MKARYGFTPAGPISVELFASTEHFAVRTVGLPHIGVQGVCFGKVLTALSPRGGEFNWGQILWHELSHVFHVQLSKSRVPRWFTEGLAEYETTRARPEWKREDDRALWDALVKNEVPELASLNHAFTHARSAGELMVAYYASSVAVTYIIERFGFRLVPKMLAAWAQGKPTDRVFSEVLGRDLSSLDAEFRAATRARLATRYARDFRVDLHEERELPALKQATEATGAGRDTRARYALGLALSLGTFELDCEWIRVVERRGCHWQTNDNASALVELSRRQHDERMYVLHLATGLRIAIDPDHVSSVGAPASSSSHYNASLPIATVAIASPPCRAGSKAASFCASVSFGVPMARTSTFDSSADTSTGWPTLKRAERATAAGIRTARLLPHC
jgi:hypothetical protein